MSDGAIARYYGRNLGMIAGLFAFLQVLVSVSSARANLLLMHATQGVITNITNNIVQSPLNLLSDLVPTLIATYAAMFITGVIMLGFAFRAGRATAQEVGRHTGALAGFWVALISGTIWIVVSLLGAIILRADGTISGVLTSGANDRLVPQVVWLLIQELPLALLGLGFGALAGLIGAATAKITTRPAYAPYTPFPAIPARFQPYPAQGYQPPSAPVNSPANVPAYPPAPEFYQTQQDSNAQG
ncbi:MAG TPA: hypothetical protein VH393_12660 [Ktedonobacterales bacterium]|jgi:hypothetical protein